MIGNSEAVAGLRTRYNVHPLIFFRTMEKACSLGEAFDILDSMPDLPVVWDENLRRWSSADLSLSKEKEELEGDI